MYSKNTWWNLLLCPYLFNLNAILWTKTVPKGRMGINNSVLIHACRIDADVQAMLYSLTCWPFKLGPYYLYFSIFMVTTYIKIMPSTDIILLWHFRQFHVLPHLATWQFCKAQLARNQRKIT